MAIELIGALREALGVISAITESIEKTVASAIGTSNSISEKLDSRRIRKIADALSLFYFTPVGVRLDLQNFISNPSDENREFLFEKLRDNQEIIERFSRAVYENLDADLFQLPMQEMDYIFNEKSRLQSAIYNAGYELAQTTPEQRVEYLDQLNSLFDDLNGKIEAAVQSIRGYK